MTPRSIRRAAARKAVKVARKTAAQQPLAEAVDTFIATAASTDASAAVTATEPSAPALAPPSAPPVCRQPESDPLEPSFDLPVPAAVPSPARLAANRANSQLSTGPRTAEGKAKVSLNAVKNGLTGRTVLLPSDDAAAYENYLIAVHDSFHPVGPAELALVQSIAENRWRMLRAQRIENNIFAKGLLEFSESFNHRPAAERASLSEVETFLKYEKQLRNLQLQESRLGRRLDKETAELSALQKTRQQEERRRLELAAKLYLEAKRASQPFNPTAAGFEFSTREIERFLAANPRLTAAPNPKTFPAAA